MKKLILFSIAFIVIAANFSCSEDVLVEADIPPHINSGDNLFASQQGFETALNGLRRLVTHEKRGDLRSGTGGSPNFPVFDYLLAGTDDAFQPNRNENQEHTLLTDWGATNSSEVGAYRFIWEWLYQTINASNTIIDRSANPQIDWLDEDKNRIVGEARFIRAWAYRHLTYLWGEVPLVLEESTTVRLDYQRASLESIYDAMEEDLKFAENNMPIVAEIDGRPSAPVAKHYLAELYIVQNRLNEAIAKTDEVINDGSYELVDTRYGVDAGNPGVPYSDMFLPGNSSRSEGNTEVLWSFTYDQASVPDHQSGMIRWFNQRYDNSVFGTPQEQGDLVKNGGRGLFRIGYTSWALRNFDDPLNDDRFSEFAVRKYWITADNDSTPATTDWDILAEETYQDASNPQRMYRWPATRKWEVANPEQPAASSQWNDLIYLRLAETILLKAEAQAMQGDVSGAATTLNILRERAGAQLLTSADIDEVLNERSRELWSEEHRRYTLLRHNEWLERTKLFNVTAGPNITERDKLYPIPQQVIDANIDAQMGQNQGY